LALLLTVFSVIISIVILVWSSFEFRSIVRSELSKLLQRNHDIVTIILEHEVEHLNWVTRDLKLNVKRIFDSTGFINSEEFRDGFVSLYDQSMGEDLDIMIFVSYDHTEIIDASSPFFDTDGLISYIKSHENEVGAEAFVYNVAQSPKPPFTVLLSNSLLLSPYSGEILGKVYMGKVLNNNPELIREIQRRTGMDSVGFVADGVIILGSQGVVPEGKINSVCASPGEAVNNGMNNIIYCQKLSIRGKSTPVMFFQTVGDSSLSVMKKRMVVRTLVIVLLIIALTLISVYWFKRITKKSLSSLIDYAHKISAMSSDTTFEPTLINEFNRLGDAVFQMNAELKETQAYLGNLMNFAKAPLIAWDAENKIVLYNKAMEDLTGVETERAMGKGIEIIFDCLSGDKLKELLMNSVKNEETLSNFESVVVNTKSGDLKYVLWNLSNVSHENRIFGVVLQGIDITDRKSSEEKLLLASKVFENTIEAIYITNTAGIVLSVNKAFYRITGYSEEEAIGSKTSILRSGRHSNNFYSGLWASLKDSGKWQGEIWNRRKNGELFPAQVNISSIKDSNGKISHFIGVMHDITERKKYEEQIKYQSHYDPLTNLPNRYLFQDRLSMAISRARKNRNYVGLISIDIDRFKNVNDTLGHNVGDVLLQRIADRIVSTVGDSITVSRLGGDEYTIILEDLTDKNRAVTIAHNVIKQLEKPFDVDDYELFLKCSAGLSFYPDDGEDVFTVAKNADAAMYRAKSKGRGMLQIYTTEFNDSAKDRLILETKLNRALDNKEFVVFYQAKIGLKNMEMVGMEALIRWENPELGKVYPDMFIPIAEETGLIVPIGQWVLKRSCEDMNRWRKMGYNLKVAVNLSLKQFIQKDLYSSVKSILTETGTNPEHVEMEITESTIMVDPENTKDILEKLSTLGISFAIDDFGTGFSSIGYLTKIPIDTVKIDKSFTLSIDTNKDSLSIVRTIIQLSQNLGIDVVAEGIENSAHLNLLRDMECGIGQGYYFSRPVPPDEFEEFLKNWDKETSLEIKTGN
jgi:diguanylate cyclase (GGDEF)-like protein/PAS domain S-box-containing protein